MAKQRIHNEWFQSIAKGKCPCGINVKQRVAKGMDPSCYAWGEYGGGSWRTVKHFCQDCFKDRVLTQLIAHARPCGCEFQLNARSGHSLPDWIRMPDSCSVAA